MSEGCGDACLCTEVASDPENMRARGVLPETVKKKRLLKQGTTTPAAADDLRDHAAAATALADSLPFAVSIAARSSCRFFPRCRIVLHGSSSGRLPVLEGDAHGSAHFVVGSSQQPGYVLVGVLLPAGGRA